MSARQATIPVEAMPDDVAALLRARTKDSMGRELGTWTEETRPSSRQVQEQIDIARSLVRIDAGGIPDECAEGSEASVALLAALLVESGYFPEQVSQGQSPYNQLLALYQQAREGLAQCLEAHRPIGGGFGVYELNLAGPEETRPIDWWQRDWAWWRDWARRRWNP